MLIIDRLELRFPPGLNVLTGETGAGKSILLDALGFVLGWRGRAELVRQGAADGEVTAVFELGPDHPARNVLDVAGLPAEDELILRRLNTAEGRKTAWVNDRRVSGEVLRSLSDTLVELHGQQDDRGLLNPSGHRALLDAFGGSEDARAAVRKAWSVWRSAVAVREEAAAAGGRANSRGGRAGACGARVRRRGGAADRCGALARGRGRGGRGPARRPARGARPRDGRARRGRARGRGRACRSRA